MQVTDKQLERAKDVAARAACDAYSAALAAEMERLSGTTDWPMPTLDGRHEHVALLASDDGKAHVIHAIWMITFDPKDVASVIARLKPAGQG